MMVQSCNRTDSQAAESSSVDIPAQVKNNGAEIIFPPHSPQLEQIMTDTVRSEDLHLDIIAPAHITASIVHSELSRSNLYLFETQDLTQLYSDLVKSRSTLDRSQKQVERERDLQAHKAVAEKELQDAEHEYTEAQADLAEKESRLRSAGIDPKVLQQTSNGSVWIIAEVPENRLKFVQPHARTEFACTSYPDEKWEGRILSVGDVIDPATRTIKVSMILSNRNGKLRPGMFGQISFSESEKSVITVHRNAVVNVDGKTYVFKNNGSTFHRAEIHIGAETHDRFIVMQGVDAGDVIANGGVILLKQLSFGY